MDRSAQSNRPVSGLAEPPRASAAVTSNDRFPLAFGTTSPCTGEPIDLEGSLRVTTRLTEDRSGGAHVGFHLTLHAVGFGQFSGTEYVAGETLNEGQNYVGADTYTFTDRGVGVVGKGEAANWKFKSTFHVTVNANGDPVATVIEPTGSECRG